MRTLDELVLPDDSAWPLIQEWIDQAAHPVEVLPASREDREHALLQLQVTTRSTLGAVAYETGGLLIDHGWVRVLGAGHPRLPRSLPSWNDGRTRSDGAPLPNCLLVADDALGGFFALDGGAFEGPSGAAYYFAPDTLEWEHVADGYSALLRFLLTGELAGFYESLRWPGWEGEVERLTGDRGISVYSPPWLDVGKEIAKSSRRDVPLAELFRVQVIEYPGQLAKE